MSDINLATTLVNSGQQFSKAALAEPLFAISENLKYMRHTSMLRGDDTSYQLRGNGEFVPYQTNGDAQNPGSIAARTLTTYHADHLEEFDPESIYKTIFDKPLSKSKITMDMVRAIVVEDMRYASSKLNNAIWSGVRNENGTNSLANFNGFDTIIANEKAAATPTISFALGNYMQLGQITPYNAGDKLELMYQMASEELKGDDSKKLVMFMPQSVRSMYIKWYNNHFANAQYTKEYDQIYLHCAMGKVELACPPGTSNINHIILTSKLNMRLGSDGIGEGEDATGNFMLRIPDNPRLVQVYADCWMGVQFEAIEKEYLMCASFTKNNGAIYLNIEPESVDFGEIVKNTTSTKTFVVNGVNLTSSLTVTVNGGGGKVTSNTATITASQAMATGGKTVTLTYAPTAAGTNDCVVVIASATDDIYMEIPVVATAANS